MAPELGRPLLHLPVIPEDVLKKHRVNLPFDDTRFRSAARLLQALWREERGLPIGSYIGEDGKRHQLGSRISNAAGAAGANFLTAEIFHIARREVAYREIGALIDVELERAQGYLIELLPAFTGTPTQLIFESSPGRGNPKFTGDYTAFDAFIGYTDFHSHTGFIAPHVGIFWLVQTPDGKARLLTAGCPLDQAEPYSDCLTYAPALRNLCALAPDRTVDPALRGIARSYEYEDWPRGRIVFDRLRDLFTVEVYSRQRWTQKIDCFFFYGRPTFLRFARRPSIANGPEPPKTRAARHAR